MLVNVRFLDQLKLEASFDDFKILADQPIRYKGDGAAPGPFDYFLASSALCAAYFIKVYCKARGIPTQDIQLSQNNLIDPKNRYHQDIHFKVVIPDSISEKDKKGIRESVERCTVKRVIQNSPNFNIEILTPESNDIDLDFKRYEEADYQTILPGKDCSLEETISSMRLKMSNLDINIEIASWRNPIPHVWSVHIRDADSPMCFTNGKGSTKEAALCSALGEYFERISNNYFYNDFYLGKDCAQAKFVHYPDEQWFPIPQDDSIPKGLMDKYLLRIYGLDGELKGHHLIDTNSGDEKRGICALPFKKQSNQEKVYIPVNILGNLFVSNGMSAGNSFFEARVQALSEIFERAVKNKIILEEISLPDIPICELEKFPKILEGIKELESRGFPTFFKDASLGGLFPVTCVTIMNPRTGGVFASFGSHPCFEVALERSLTELLQGRSFEGLSDVPLPTLNQSAIIEHNNIVEHFIDSTGVISWKFFSSRSDYDFVPWNFIGSTEEEFHYLMKILTGLEKEVYIADYNDLGVNACRIIVPDYSEIYQIDDLIWDNNNKALLFREDILNIHQLSDDKLKLLLNRFDEIELDDYMPISELIGLALDENSVWGQLNIAELKCMILLALGKKEEAKEYVELFFSFNDHSHERKMFFQALNVVLDIELDEQLEFSNFQDSLKKMYGPQLVQQALDTALGHLRFPGMSKTSLKLEGLDKHLKLIESYEKLKKVRLQSFKGLNH
jgi:ribosomal protein S12 methylthiotransferase accessory factor